MQPPFGADFPVRVPLAGSNHDDQSDLSHCHQIDVSVLNVGYAEVGPTDGPVVLLLHGWPYDIHSYVDVAPLLFIQHCRSLDMTLDEIRNLLRFRDAPAENCSEVNALLDEHIEHVSNRIKELRFLENYL